MKTTWHEKWIRLASKIGRIYIESIEEIVHIEII